jgi:hypothetical protein
LKASAPLRQGHPDFSQAFVKHARKQLDTAAATYERLAQDAAAFDPLDARQLAKHFLAAKRAVVDSSGPVAVILLCIWWEPEDASEYPVSQSTVGPSKPSPRPCQTATYP